MKKNSYIRESYFHGRNAVAPLKRADGGTGQSCQPDFHGRNAVAPLKLKIAPKPVAKVVNFHGRNAVAPLKLCNASLEA